MATRIPLIVNTAANQIQELPTGDSLTGISTLTATEFIGETSNIGVSTVTRSVIGLASVTELVVSGVSTFSSTVTVDNGGLNVTGVVTATTFSGSGASLTNIPNGALTNSSVSFGNVSLNLGGSDSSPAFNLADATGLPVSTGISGLGANVANFLATPSSANLAAAVTNETGSGALVFATSPSLVSPSLGNATATNINVSGIVTASNGFSSGNGAVQITVSGSTLTFTVAGVGSTTLTLS